MVVGGRELIDTLWNVNLFMRFSRWTTYGINRYIMECKCPQKMKRKRMIIELIDTLWNVNG